MNEIMEDESKSALISRYVESQVKDDALWAQSNNAQKALQILHLMLREWDIEQIKKEIMRYEKDLSGII